MAGVTYLGPSLALRHRGTTFPLGQEVKVPYRTGLYYLDEAAREGPWAVRLSVIEKVRRLLT